MSSPLSPSSTLQLALPIPLRRLFDYCCDEPNQLPPGTRVSVPFGHQKAVMGIVVSHSEPATTAKHKLRPIHAVLDQAPVFDQHLLELCQWCADYYHYPLGEVLHLALPALLRKPQAMPIYTETVWQITDVGLAFDIAQLKRADRQQQALRLFQANRQLSAKDIKQQAISPATLKALGDKQLIRQGEDQPLFKPLTLPEVLLKQNPLSLTDEQQQAVDAIRLSDYTTCLLEGITGSGKTEVYLQVMEKVLLQGGQILVLVPEIGLTPQTLARFEARFNVPVAALHSGLSDRRRLAIWQQARHGQLPIIIGTRSAIFTPLPELGLIIVDEEHDGSYKQQEGVRYSARDLAIVRAQKLKIPLILGSATPSLESLHNGLSGRYRHLSLTQRPNAQALPTIECIDEPFAAQNDGRLTEDVINGIRQALRQRQQVLVFINRRGYAPTLLCQDCGWISQCPNCDSRMTLHHSATGQNRRVLHCHYCDYRSQVPAGCPHCHSRRLAALGSGTQRSEEALGQLFTETPVIRIDSDSVSRKGQLQAALAKINSGEPCLLTGTQMLAKGHHFANLGLAVILGLDNAFFSSDFRGAERMGQLLTQVAGRTGREQQQGKVLIQTQFASHPLLQQLLTEGYHDFATTLLAERQLTAMPPFEHLALIRCHAQQPEAARQFLQQVRLQAQQVHPPHDGLQYLGPFPATPEKRNNRFHAILPIKAASRRERQQLLRQLCGYLENTKPVRGLHWLVDVDPQVF